MEAIVFDHAVRPDNAHQRRFVDDFTASLNEIMQRSKGPRWQLKGLASSIHEQLPRRVQSEPSNS